MIAVMRLGDRLASRQPTAVVLHVHRVSVDAELVEQVLDDVGDRVERVPELVHGYLADRNPRRIGSDRTWSFGVRGS
jgi:hypothetical protein